jgi:hypothetical protein
VKDDLAISGTGSDAALGRLISAASARMAAECDRVFLKESVTETFRATQQLPGLATNYYSQTPVEPLVLKRRPVRTLTSLTADSVALVAGTDFELDALAGVAYRLTGDTRTVWTNQKIVAVYDAGYDPPGTTGGSALSVPQDLQAAVRSLVRTAWFGRGRDPLVRSEEVPGVLRQDYWVGSVPGSSDLPADVLDAVETYRNIKV